MNPLALAHHQLVHHQELFCTEWTSPLLLCWVRRPPIVPPLPLPRSVLLSLSQEVLAALGLPLLFLLFG